MICLPMPVNPIFVSFQLLNFAIKYYKSKVAEAVEVNEAAEVLRPEKALLRASESSRFLNSALY